MNPPESYHRTPYELEVAINGFFARFEILDNMFALSTANQMAPHTGNKTPKPKKLRLFQKQEAQNSKVDKETYRALRQASSRRAG